jgi:hypothetical protein
MAWEPSTFPHRTQASPTQRSEDGGSFGEYLPFCASGLPALLDVGHLTSRSCKDLKGIDSTQTVELYRDCYEGGEYLKSTRRFLRGQVRLRRRQAS